MAEVFVTPVTLNITARQNTWQQFKSPVIKDAAGAAVDMSAWFSLTCELQPGTGPLNVGQQIGTLTGGSDGILTLTIAPADYSGIGIGTAQVNLLGVKASGDDPQYLGGGTANILSGT